MTICKFGKGVQDASTCRMIYIHWPGYYPTEESYQAALKLLCPNYKEVKMNTDLTTTVAGVVAGIAAILGAFNIIIPQQVSGAIVAIAVSVLGYYTNKATKPQGGTK